jgi:hypothetical protein
MDDRELEARLKTRLHARFDEPPIPSDLGANLRQAMTTLPTSFSFQLRARRRWLGWPAMAAVVAVAIVAISVGRFTVPGLGGRPTPSPVASVASERHFIVLAPGALPSKPESSLAVDILDARLRALGIGNFTSGVGNAMQFIVPADGPSDASIRAVLAATGDVEFVPLPVADYGLGAGKRQAAIGQPLPKDEPALFGWEGIASANPAYDPGNRIRTVNVSLKPDAAAAFGDYTTSHPGETFAIVIDGRVAMLPVISEPITGGEVNVSGGVDEDYAFTAAILVGGMLPEAWRGAEVPEIITRDAAIAAAVAGRSDTIAQSANLEAIATATGWQAVWTVETSVPDGSSTLMVDAETGSVIAVPIPATSPTPAP